MKRIALFLVALTGWISNGLSQPIENPSQYLAENEHFINFITVAVGNGAQMGTELKRLVGDKREDFLGALEQSTSQEDFDGVLADYGVSRESFDARMAEQVAYGLVLKAHENWIWTTDPEKLKQIMKDALFHGFNTTDPRWEKIRTVVFGGSSTTQGKISVYTIIDCLYEEVKQIIRIAGNFAAIVAAANEGNVALMIAEIKMILKRASKKFGWIGLAWTAFDVAMCILDDL